METNGRVKKRNRNNVKGNPRCQNYHLCINLFYYTTFILIGKKTNARHDDGASDSCSDAEAYRNNGLQHAPSNSHVQSSACVDVDIYDTDNANYWINVGGSNNPLAAIGQTVEKEFFDAARGEKRMYKGTVTGWDGRYYQIDYTEDNDNEDMSSNEVALYNC